MINLTRNYKPPHNTLTFPYVKLMFASMLIGLTVNANGQDLAQPPSGPAPQVQAIDQLPLVNPSYSPGEEKPQPAAIHPPLGDIPPMPMPYPPADTTVSPATQGFGVPVVRDLTTGKVSTGPEASAAIQQMLSQGGYYAGADGGSAEGELTPAAFGTKSLINNVGSAPWRMNVKVAFRFGTSWFVCSGAMRDIRTVQTAGHCIHQGNGGQFADEVLVYPGWDGVGVFIPFNPNAQTHGGARGVALGALTGWTINGNFDSDWGVIALDRAVGALTGWYGWQTGSTCPSGIYNVGSYPAENCPLPPGGLHNGRDMYRWGGTIDSCPGNQLQINTAPGCLTALWGGESGSNIYQTVNNQRLTRGIASTSDRNFIGRYVETSSQWVNYLNNTFIPNQARGNTFDLQALDTNVSPSTIQAGGSTSSLNHLAVNGTNGSRNATFNYEVRLSNNDSITPSDTLLANQSYSFNFGAVSSVRVNSANVTIPGNTPPGTYWIGVRYANSTDTNPSNNDSSDWDAHRITVTATQALCKGQPVTISGTSGSDNLVGTAGRDVIHGFGGSDTIDGAGGNDIICGGNGDDTIRGGPGADTIYSGNGNDTVFGQTGWDTIFAGGGGDRVFGGLGNDTIFGHSGNDELFGQGGNDSLSGSQGNDLCNGGGGSDSANGSCETQVGIP